jgi:predicted Zn-dependent protease
MLGKERLEDIANSILSRSTADQTEVVIIAGDHCLTRFANSTIHQNVAERDAEVGIRVVLDVASGGPRIGVAKTNQLDDQSLEQARETAMAIARLQPENLEFKSLPGPLPLPEVTGFAQATAAHTAEQRAQDAGVICLMAREAGVVASGALRTATMEMAVANSLGTSAYYPSTMAALDTVVMSDSSAGYASALAMDVADLDFGALGREAVEKCLRSRDPKSVDPGEYPVILEPYAVQDLVQMMAYTGFGAVAYQEGRSFMADKLGEQVVDPRISIWDDGQDQAGIPLPFDFEGVPRQRIDLIEHGIARGVVYDSYRAGKEGKTSTGHALPAPDTFGPFPWNTFFDPGDATIEEMIASTERGIYVTRFHYTRPVVPKEVVITGMTRDGTYFVENGKIAYPIKNLRFTQSYLDALNEVEMVGNETRLLPGFGGVARDSVPALKLGRFAFTGATEF